jgi:hypothetical protein
MRALLSSILVLVALAFGATAASAQNNPIVGLWSSTMPLPNGSPYATFLYQFNPDGTYQEQMTVISAGIAQYAGRWQFDPQAMTLSIVLTNYSPLNIPPLQQVGVTYTEPVQFGMNGGVLLINQDSGPPLQLTRQR